MANSYYAKSYADWKKKWGVNAGERADGMTDNDYALGLYLEGQDTQKNAAQTQYDASMSSLQKSYDSGKNTLAEAYNLGKSNLEAQYNNGANAVNSAYNSNLATLDANRKTSEQNADVLHQKMQKYLGTQADAAGLSNTGYASPESLKLRANASYNQNLGNIAADYNANKTSLDNQRTSSLAELQNQRLAGQYNLDQTKLSGLSSLENAYMTGAEKAESTKNAANAELDAANTNYLLNLYGEEAAANKAQVDSDYNSFYQKGANAVNSMTGEEGLAYVESIKDNLRAEDYDELVAQANSKITQTASDKADASHSDYANKAATAINSMTGEEAIKYIESEKANYTEADYNWLKSLAESKKSQEDTSAAEKADEAKKAQYSEWAAKAVDAINGMTGAEAYDWIEANKDNLSEGDYSIYSSIAKSLKAAQEKAAAATTEAEKKQAAEEAYDSYYSMALTMLNGAKGAEAKAYIEKNKDNIRDSQYDFLVSLADSIIAADQKTEDEKTEADLQAEIDLAYESFKSLVAMDYFDSTAEAKAWLVDKGIAGHLDTAGYAKYVDTNAAMKAAASEAEKNAIYSENVANVLQNAGATEAKAFIETVKDNLSQADYDTYTVIVDSMIQQEENIEKAKAANDKEAEYDAYYNYAVNMFDLVDGATALKYLEDNKGKYRTEEYDYLTQIANYLVKAEEEQAGLDDDAKEAAQKETDYQIFLSYANYGAFDSSDDAMEWAEMHGIGDYLDVGAIAGYVDKNAKETEAQKTKETQDNAYNNLSTNLQYITDPDEAWALFDETRDSLSADQARTAELYVKQNFGARDAVTLDKFKSGTPIGGYKYESTIKDAELNDSKFSKAFANALKQSYNTDEPYDSGLDNGSVVTFDVDNKGWFTGSTQHTLMYLDGVWYEVKKYTNPELSKYLPFIEK